jgi:hypothetical protein
MKAARKTSQLLLETYSLSHKLIETRVQNSSTTTMDNIFIHNARFSSFCISLIVNGLSDHDAQFLIVNNIMSEVNSTPLKQETRKINNETIAHFQHL